MERGSDDITEESPRDMKATSKKTSMQTRMEESIEKQPKSGTRFRKPPPSPKPESAFSPNDMEVFKQPMCLVSNDDGNKLQIEEKTVQQIKAISWPMIVVAVVGLYRTGKSYLMNHLAGSKKGFEVGDTIQATTKGIWVWCVIHPTSPNTVLVLLDTEGLSGIEQENSSYDNRIFSLATLLCNCLVYNMKNAFNLDAVYKLTFITEMTKNVRYRNTESHENEYLKLILPDFVLCIKDFTLKMIKDGKKITEDEYLEECLKEQTRSDRFNKPRECIKKYFPVRKCFTFPFPGDNDVVENLDTLPFDALSDRFKDATKRFVSHVYGLKPKALLASKPINGLMFTTLATNYVAAIRHDAIPDVDDAFLATAKIENSRIKEEALKIFENSLTKVVLPAPSTKLEVICTHAEHASLQYLRENVVRHKGDKTELEAQQVMENAWHKLQKKNSDKFLDLCEEKLKDAFTPLKNNITKKVYEEAGGYNKFKRDLNLMQEEFRSSLQDFTVHEVFCHWITFLEKLKPTESKIINADENMSRKEKEDERKRNEEFIRELNEKHEKSKNEALEHQRKSFEKLQDDLRKEREISEKIEMERFKQFLEVKCSKEELEAEMDRLRKDYDNMREQERKSNEELLETRQKVEKMLQEEKERKARGVFRRIYYAVVNK